MFSLRITLNGQTFEVDPRRPSRIGSSPQADIKVFAPSVAPFHAELRPSEQGWMLVDLESPAGTYVDGQRIRQLSLAGNHEVYLGAQGHGVGLSAASVAPQQPPGVPEGYRQPPDTQGYAMTQAVETNPRRQGPPTGPDIIVRVRGEDRRFPHPQLVTIGRHPDCTVRLTDPVVSRFHGRIDPVPGGWTYSNASKAGTYVKGRRIDSVTLEESQPMRLGHPDAGVEVELIPVVSAAEASRRIESRARRQRRRSVTMIGAAVVLVLALVTGGVLLLSGGGDNQITEEALDNAKLASVQIIGQDPSTGEAWSGSGSVLTPDGLILTNSHVADPTAFGQAFGISDFGNSPPYLLVGVHSAPNQSEFETVYRARRVATQTETDSSLIQIYADENGQPVSSLDLPTVPVGSSSGLESGQPLWVLGFPGISESSSVSVTTGTVSTTNSTWEGMDVIDTDARVAHGNSGGMAINADGELVGVPTGVVGDDMDSPAASGKAVEIDAIKSFIDPHL